MPLKVLLVCLRRDGDPPLALLLQQASLPEGSQVEVASDAERAAWLLAQQRFDVALVDLPTAEPDVLALCRTVRTGARATPLPLVLVFATPPAAALASQLSQAGPTAILSRPLPAATLLASVQSLTSSPLAGVQEELAMQAAVEGDLSQYPLAWLLVQGAAAEVTGTLKLMRGKVRKLVYVLQGRPIFVDSNLRNETLGAYLIACKTLDERQLARALQQARATGNKLGEALLDLELVDEATVLHALEDQVRLKLSSALRWPDGAFAWVPGDTFSDRVPSYPVEPVDLVLSALKLLIRSEHLTQMLTPHLDQTLFLTPAGGQFITTIDRTFGSKSLQRVLAGEQLRQVLAETKDVAALLIAAEALRQSGLAVFGELDATPEQIPGLTAAASPPEQPGPSAEELEPSSTPPAAPLEPRPRRQSLLGLESLDPTLTEPAGEAMAIPLMEPAGEGALVLEALDSGLLVVENHTAPPSLPAPTKTPAVPPRTPLAPHPTTPLAPPRTTPAPSRTPRSPARSQLAPPPEAAPSPLRAVDARPAAATSGAPDSFIIEPALPQPANSTPQPADSTSPPQPPPEADGADAFGAELAFQEGQTLLRQNALGGAVEAFIRAVETNDNQPDYHAYLGWGQFLLKGRGSAGALAARPHLDRAFRISPDSAEAHELAGRIEQDSRNGRQAAAHFVRALAAGPLRLELFNAIRELLLQLNDYDELERQYRNVLFRLRDKDQEKARTVGLWIDLAYLYLQRLGRQHDAKISLEVAAKLAPGDPRVRAALAEIAESSSQSWSLVAEGHRQRLLANPQDLSPLHALYALHTAAGRDQQALVAAALLAHQGAATSQESAFLAQAKQALPSAAPPLKPAMLERLKAPADRPEIEAVMTLLSPALARKLPVSLESLQSSPQQILNLSTLAPPLRQGLRHASQQLSLHLPRLYVSQAPGLWALPLPMEQAALVLTQELLDSGDPLLVTFAVARALSCSTAGRRHLFSRPVSQLKEPILALLAFARAPLCVPDPETSAGSWQQLIARAGADRTQLEGLLDQLLQQTKINLSLWRRAVRCTSARVGLVVCGSIQAALRGIAAEREDIWDLASFALEGQPA